MPTSAFLSLRTTTERISMKFGDVNHYHINRWTDYILDEVVARDKGEGYDRKFESTSNRCYLVACDFPDFTVHMAHCVRRAGESVTHIQRRRHRNDHARSLDWLLQVPLLSVLCLSLYKKTTLARRRYVTWSVSQYCGLVNCGIQNSLKSLIQQKPTYTLCSKRTCDHVVDYKLN